MGNTMSSVFYGGIVCRRFTRVVLSRVTMVTLPMVTWLWTYQKMITSCLTVGIERDVTDGGLSMSLSNDCMTTDCDEQVSPARFNLGYPTCLKCGEVSAGKRKFTVVPMHKSNYVVISNKQELKGINNKGGLYE